jgi:two-component system, cell cycle response regulator
LCRCLGYDGGFKKSTIVMKKSNSIKIIVADDSAVSRKLIEQALAKGNYDLLWARNGREAIRLFIEHHPTIVITNWEMPDLTGIDLCTEIRRQQDSFVYVILLTANSQKQQIIEGLTAGADDYLTKPFDAGELLARVAVGRRFAELYRDIETKNQLLEELARTDSLTGLPNRRAVEEWSARQLSGAARHGFPMWITIADLDNFKTVNDSYGHEAGDLVLKRVAEIMKTNTRFSNLCGRLGGEEFVIVLSQVDRHGAREALERLRTKIESERFNFSGTTVNVTASFGVAGFHDTKSPEFADLLRHADEALYVAKQTGRNRIQFTAPDDAAALEGRIGRTKQFS